MSDSDLQHRLSRISTMWTLLERAHAGSMNAEASAKGALIERYQGAIYRYLMGAVRNSDAADDLFQEFALRFVRGSFRSAAPDRGRFRDFLKRSLINLVSDYRKGLWRRPGPLEADVAASGDAPANDQNDQLFQSSWRDELLARAWIALEGIEREGGTPFHSVLRYRADHPAASAADMAIELNQQLHPNPPFNEQSIRKVLQRARERFADSLLADVAATLEQPTHAELETELIELGLLPYCRSALDRRRA